MSISIDDLNEAVTLSKSVKYLIIGVLDYTADQGDDELSSILYGLQHTCESIINNQQSAIDQLLKIDIK